MQKTWIYDNNRDLTIKSDTRQILKSFSENLPFAKNGLVIQLLSFSMLALLFKSIRQKNGGADLDWINYTNVRSLLSEIGQKL